MFVNVLLSKKNEQKMIPLEQLVPSPHNTYAPENIEDLAKNIKACGLLTPLTVIGPNDEGKFEIVSGERRFRAISMIHEENPDFLPEVPCHIIDLEMDDLRKQLAIEISNVETRDHIQREHHRFNIVRLFNQLAEQGDMNQRQIANELAAAMKTSDRYSRMYAAVYKHGIEAVMEGVKSDNPKANEAGDPVHIPVEVASKISQLDPEIQEEIVANINAGDKPLDAYNAARLKYGLFDSSKKPTPASAPAGRPIITGYEEDEVYSGATEEDGLEEYGSDPDESDYGQQSVVTPENENGKSNDRAEKERIIAAIEQADQEGEDWELDDESYQKFFGGSMPDLNIDTTGKLKQLQSGSGGSSNKVLDERRIVTGWIERMNRILDREDTLDPDDAALIEEFAVLAEKYNKSI